MVLSLGKTVLEFLLLDFCGHSVGFFKSTNILFDAISGIIGFMLPLM